MFLWDPAQILFVSPLISSSLRHEKKNKRQRKAGGHSVAAKSTTTIRQVLSYQPHQAAWFAATQTLFNRICAFYFEVIQAHERVLDLSNKEALTALERLTHTTQSNPAPVMALQEVAQDIPALFRRAALNPALGSARTFFSHLQKWPKPKQKTLATGNISTTRPPTPPPTPTHPLPSYKHTSTT